ncbi:hypothetical protein I350_07675 [Cryptococcus amylolentus CBS 6273]|uniref:Uncharacterized protein n=1 Tax=Cryptococcus amylolentus CBS 6273 TaxID=1296118 RepID=A0A1E3JAY2_9TREE|nr:hypothetical protein I350_07675 [Cryptococcus amylolentus CBS 6273]
MVLNSILHRGSSSESKCPLFGKSRSTSFCPTFPPLYPKPLNASVNFALQCCPSPLDIKAIVLGRVFFDLTSRFDCGLSIQVGCGLVESNFTAAKGGPGQVRACDVVHYRIIQRFLASTMLALLERLPRPRSEGEAVNLLCQVRGLMKGVWADIDQAFNNSSSMRAFETIFLPFHDDRAGFKLALNSLRQDILSDEWEPVLRMGAGMLKVQMIVHSCNGERRKSYQRLAGKMVCGHLTDKRSPLSEIERGRVEEQLRVNIDCTPSLESPCCGRYFRD